MNNDLSIIILAAGNGKRMHSDLPKVLQPLGGVSMLERVVASAHQLNPKRIFVIYGNHGTLPKTLSHLDVEWIRQEQPVGTADAVAQALPYISSEEHVMVLYGDVPLISPDTLSNLVQEMDDSVLGLLVTELENPTAFGRIVRDSSGQILRIVEEKDATSDEKLIKEINTGIMLIPANFLKEALPKISNENAQKEYYLTDIVAQMSASGGKIQGINVPKQNEVQGVNTLKELAFLERVYQYETACRYLEQGVFIQDPNRFDLRGHLEAERGVRIDVNAVLEGNISLGKGCKIGANVHLKNVVIGEGVEIKPNSVIEDAIIQDECVIGPFARIRPGTELAKKAKVGNFVEIKNTKLGEGSKANHLTYLGDSIIEENVNVGAGVITCNYDGVQKYQTRIESGAFIGSSVQLVAPVTVHANATIGAGSTITENVPQNTLALGRSRQVIIESWERNKERKEKISNDE